MEILKSLWLYIIAFIVYLVSGNTVFLKGLFFASLIEYFSSIRLDYVAKKMTTLTTVRKLYRKFWYIPLLVLTTQVDYIVKEIGYSDKLPITITNMTLLYLVLSEFNKSLANMTGLGVNIPCKLKEWLKRFLDTMISFYNSEEKK